MKSISKIIVGGLAVTGLVATIAIGSKHFIPTAAQSQPPVAALQSSPTITPPGPRNLPDFAALVEQYGASVVNIGVIKDVKSDVVQELPGIDRNSPFYDFFRRFQTPLPQNRAPAGGIGSGFIVSGDGIILTNAHVVANATEVVVKLTDRREFKARVLGADTKTDVAALKIEASGLPAVKLGNPQNIRVGEWVVAIGSPFGFENTVTSGIVSAKARALPDGTYVPFIQTDVAVNPGNSGGPLFNMNGEVIGVNSHIYSGTGGYQGLSFAIPIDVAVKVKDQLVQSGKVTRGRIGVTIQDVNQSLANSFGLKKPAGALVSSVEKGGPADKAGVEPGDVVLKINGTEINRTIDLSSYVADLKPGSKAQVEVWRKGEPRNLAVIVDEAKATKSAASDTTHGDGNKAAGLAVRELSPNEQTQLGTQGGVLVEDVAGPAARAGIRPGDVVLAVNGTPVKDVEGLRKLVEKGGKTIALLVQREGAKIFVPVNLG